MERLLKRSINGDVLQVLPSQLSPNSYLAPSSPLKLLRKRVSAVKSHGHDQIQKKTGVHSIVRFEMLYFVSIDDIPLFFSSTEGVCPVLTMINISLYFFQGVCSPEGIKPWIWCCWLQRKNVEWIWKQGQKVRQWISSMLIDKAISVMLMNVMNSLYFFIFTLFQKKIL